MYVQCYLHQINVLHFLRKTTFHGNYSHDSFLFLLRLIYLSLNSNCPFPIGDYSAKNVDLQVDLQVKIPSGQYIVLANFQNQDLGHVACIQMGLSLA